MSIQQISNPVLAQFLDDFTAIYPEGKSHYRNMTIHSKTNIKLESTFLVSDARLTLVAVTLFQAKNGVLLGGSHVSIQAEEVTLQGTEESPIHIIALENFDVKASHLKLKNVIIYLKTGTFSISSKLSSEIENVRFYSVEMFSNIFIKQFKMLWKNHDDLQKYINENTAKTESESKNAALTIVQDTQFVDREKLLETLDLDREFAQMIGLRSILV